MFAKLLNARIATTKTQLCLGLDPHPSSFTQELKTLIERHGAQLILRDICCAAIDASLPQLPAVKFQMAFFEHFGAEGILALREAIAYAKLKEAMVILDAKRGDISTTMHSYGHMVYEYFAADVLTVLPYMGLAVVDALRPWLQKGRGAYVVWVSSNPEGWSVQNAIYQSLLAELSNWEKHHKLEGALGLVLGATMVDKIAPDTLAKTSSFPLLLPGFGAQGATVNAATRQVMSQNVAPLFPVSRGLLDFSRLTPSDRSQLTAVVEQAIEPAKAKFAGFLV